jgi:hypothetical protein
VPRQIYGCVGTGRTVACHLSCSHMFRVPVTPRAMHYVILFGHRRYDESAGRFFTVQNRVGCPVRHRALRRRDISDNTVTGRLQIDVAPTSRSCYRNEPVTGHRHEAPLKWGQTGTFLLSLLVWAEHG